MKFIPSVFLASTLLAGLRVQSHAQSTNDLVRVEVRVQSTSEHKDLKNTTTDATTEKKSLEITLTGKPKSPETRTGKWTLYGRDLKSHDISAIATGDFSVSLPQVGEQHLDSKTISASSTPEHSTVTFNNNARDRNGHNIKRPAVKKVEATGKKYIGYSVVVKDGGTVVGEAYDPMGLKTGMR